MIQREGDREGGMFSTFDYKNIYRPIPSSWKIDGLYQIGKVRETSVNPIEITTIDEQAIFEVE